jgi:hypothetical protein
MGYNLYLAVCPLRRSRPLPIVEKRGGSAEKELRREVLQPATMNVNNGSLADGTPVTLSFSGKVGEIRKHVPEDRDAESRTGSKCCT